VVGEVGSLQISLGEVRVDLLEARRARSKGVEFVLVLAVVGDELGVRRARNDVLLTLCGINQQAKRCDNSHQRRRFNPPHRAAVNTKHKTNN
jgi:CDGSH-type Zn-finger protein